MTVRSHARKPPWFHVLERLVREAVCTDLPAARVLSLANSVQSVLHAGTLDVTTIGEPLTQACALVQLSDVKQFDRPLSNTKLNISSLLTSWGPHVVGRRTKIVMALDWTPTTTKARSAPPTCCRTMVGQRCWRGSRLKKCGLKGNRSEAEHSVLRWLKAVLSAHVTKMILLGDRGFGDVKLYAPQAKMCRYGQEVSAVIMDKNEGIA